ncbi:hypothetical protein [Terrabacter sp. 2YAF2]|uniref:hypothetical protein n=1 Tax=Terrabacter sp. 2YAF2 TaxID=3233026 RepID=UPI003F9BBBA8
MESRLRGYGRPTAAKAAASAKAAAFAEAGLGDPGVLRAVLGGALYLTVVGLLGLGLGARPRNTALGH